MVFYNGTESFARIVLCNLGLRRRLIRRLGIFRRAVRPVAVPRSEMRDRYTPQAPARLVKVREALSFIVRDAKLCEHGRIIRRAVAVSVQVGHAAGLAEYLDYAPVIGRHPQSLLAIVVSRRYGTTNRESKEVVHVLDNWLIELNVRRARGHGFISGYFRAIRIRARGRQLGGHRFWTVLSDCVLGDAYTKRADRLRTPIGHHQLRTRALREEQRCLARAVLIRHFAPLRYLERLRGRQVYLGHYRIDRYHHHARQPRIVSPQHVYLTLGGQVLLLGVVDGDAAAVYYDVEHPVLAGQRLAVFRVIQDSNPHSRQRIALAGRHLAAQHRDTRCLDSTRSHIGLDGVISCVDELGGTGNIRRNRRVQVCRHILRIGRQLAASVTAVRDPQRRVDAQLDVKRVDCPVGIDVGVTPADVDPERRVNSELHVKRVDRAVAVDVTRYLCSKLAREDDHERQTAYRYDEKSRALHEFPLPWKTTEVIAHQTQRMLPQGMPAVNQTMAVSHRS